MAKEEKGRKDIVPYSPKPTAIPKQEKGIEIYKFPGVIVEELRDKYIARIHLKPEAEKDFQYEVGKNSLELKIGRKIEREDKGKFRYRYEMRQGEFSRGIPFSKPIDTSKVKSEYSNNIMTIILPKRDRK